jgi:hypothetical protein
MAICRTEKLCDQARVLARGVLYPHMQSESVCRIRQVVGARDGELARHTRMTRERTPRQRVGRDTIDSPCRVGWLSG